MIDLRQTEVKGDESVFAEQLTKEGISFRFGEVRAGGERQSGVFLLEQYAVSLTPMSPTIEANLKENKFRPQVWSKSEFQWDELELSRRLPLHR